jgi:hypothetical protein
MRVIRSRYRGAVEWHAQRAAVREARAVEGPAAEAMGVPALEPAVVVSGPGEHAAGAGVLVEAVGPDGTVLKRRLIPWDGCAGGRGRGHALLEEEIETTIQEARRQVVRHVGPPDETIGP